MISCNCLEREQELNECHMSVTAPLRQNTQHGTKLLLIEEDSLAKLLQKKGQL